MLDRLRFHDSGKLQKGKDLDSDNATGFAGILGAALAGNSSNDAAIADSPKVVVPDKIGQRVLTDTDKAIVSDLYEAFGVSYKNTDMDISLNGVGTSLWPVGGDMAENAEKGEEILARHMRKWMINEDVSDRPPIEMSISGNGKVVVTNNHPDKEKIEKFFEENSEARNLYAGITANKEMMVSFEESLKFQKRYAVDPVAAVREFSYLLNGSFKVVTSATMSNGQFDFKSQGMITIV
jgi:hypothetical protein